MNHNELEGWADDTLRPAHVFLLTWHPMQARLRKRFSFLRQFLQKQQVHLWEYESTSEDLLLATLELTLLGDWYSYFLAQQRQVDPVPVPYIQDLKNFLSG